MPVVRSLARPIHGIARQNGRFQLRGHFGQKTSIDIAFRLSHRLCDMVR